MEGPNLLSAIDAMIAALSKQLLPSDRKDGWTETSQNAIRAFFEQMRADVVAGKDISNVPHYVAVVRGLDHWGICGGRLFEEAAEIGKMVKDSA